MAGQQTTPPNSAGSNNSQSQDARRQDSGKTAPCGDLLLAGVVGAAHGIKGEVHFRLNLENPDIIQNEGVLFAKDKTPFFIALWRETEKGVLVAFKNVKDRNGAQALRGQELYLDAAALPPLAPDEFYYKDLIGLTAYDHRNQHVGRIAEVFFSGAQHILVIRASSGQEFLVPFLDETVHNVCENHLKLTQDADMFWGIE